MNKLWFEIKGEKGKPKSQGGSTFASNTPYLTYCRSFEFVI